MHNPTIYRHFDCEGWCGLIIEIPAHYASAIAYPNGTLRADVHLVCDDCERWLKCAVEDAHGQYPLKLLRAGKP
jgi:hypothetical protein